MSLLRQRIVHTSVGAIAALVITASAAAQARTLSYAASSPPTDSGVNQALRWWADEIKACTEGSIKINIHWMGSLVKLADAVEAVSAGVADMAYVIPAYSHAKMPLWYLSSTAIGSGDRYIATEAFTRVRERFPAIKEEEKRNNMKYIAHFSIGPSVLISKDEPYLTPKHFDGDKVRLSSRFARAAKVHDWNVTPVNLTFPDIYSALERGTIDGAVSYLAQIRSYKHNEVADHVVEPKLGQQTNPIFMNLRVWNSLSDNQQHCFNKLQDEFMLKLAQKATEEVKDDREQLINDPEYPMEFHQLSREQRQIWENALRTADEYNIERSSKYAPKAQAIYDAYMKEMEKIEQKVEGKGYPWERN